ncbi:uncharacterized protein LOC144057765 [Vanacampus margaritifer]
MNFNPSGNTLNRGRNWNAKKYGPGKYRPQHSAHIVYFKGPSFHTVPSISTVLDGTPTCLLGLQYVWEYRSPSKTVPPHYECKLCRVARLQGDMVAHVKGAQHKFKYMKKVCPDKVPWKREELLNDPVVRKMVRDAAAEMAHLTDRGQVKVVTKEPYNVPAFKGLRSAEPKPFPMPENSMGPNGPPIGPLFNEQLFRADFPSNEGRFDEYPDEYQDEYEPSDFGNFSPESHFPDSNPDEYEPSNFGNFSPEPHFPDSNQDDYKAPNFGRFSPDQCFPDTDMSPRPYQSLSGYKANQNNGRERFSPGPMFPDEYQGPRIKMPPSLLDRPVEKPFGRPSPMEAPPGSDYDSNVLLRYLDTFRIENESDAQLVLKVTQKLTEQLMEYRLKNMEPEGPDPSGFSMSANLSPPSSSLSRSSDRYARVLPKGQLRFSGGPRRF